jgi:hypothetical protein
MVYHENGQVYHKIQNVLEAKTKIKQTVSKKGLVIRRKTKETMM